MKVNEYLNGLKGAYAGEAKALDQEKNQRPKGGVEETAPVGDKVQLSEQAREKAYARDLVSSAPEVRSDKVAAAKAKLAAGTYDVNATQVADKFLRSVISEVV
ncbi:MAG: flagellar biosynthesis anti-sigma factor FlgM [Pseudomonadota bacterium]